MYLDFEVDIPQTNGKITTRTKAETIYIYYEYDRTYDKKKQYTNVKRAVIGKKLSEGSTKMVPNENFLKYFPNEQLPDDKNRIERSSCLRMGDFLILRKVMLDKHLPSYLAKHFTDDEIGLLLDLVAYWNVSESNISQYYPDYTYNHPLMTTDMKMYSDSAVSDFLKKVTEDKINGFLDDWNKDKDHRQKVYISYDSTNKNTEAGDLELAEFGKPKIDEGQKIFNYAIAYDTNNQEPLLYEDYPGSINDISQLKCMVDKVYGYGYRNIGFILDRGYFSHKNLDYMTAKGYSFIVMVKGMVSFVSKLVIDYKGTFEEKWSYEIPEHSLSGITVKRKLYATDTEERYFHLYFSPSRQSAERKQLEQKLGRMKSFLEKCQNKKVKFTREISRYFRLHYAKDNETFLMAEDRVDVIDWEIKHCGYFVIVTSESMSAKKAIDFYKSRDVSEKLFRADKSFLGNNSMRVPHDESMEAKIFIGFLALIVRNQIYTTLDNAAKGMTSKPNFMTVPAALKELEKIELIRQLDDVYRQDHAVTRTEKTILKAFGMDEAYVKYWADKIGTCLTELNKNKRQEAIRTLWQEEQNRLH